MVADELYVLCIYTYAQPRPQIRDWIFVAMLGHVLTLLACLVSSAVGTSWIVPGAVWNDASGKKIDAHGGGIIKRGDTFYWIGQSASNSK